MTFWERWQYDPRSPRVADLCSGAGGAAYGVVQQLKSRGLNPRVVGFDIKPQPHYPYSFVRADVLQVDLEAFDLIWASPPCQLWSVATAQGRYNGREYPDVLTPLRPRIVASGKPYIIENVIQAPLLNPIMLCGQMFGLQLLRHRIFESNLPLVAPPHPTHKGLNRGPDGDFVVVVKMAADRDIFEDHSVHIWRRAMGIRWMNANELSQAVPPAYSEYLAQFYPWEAR